MVAPRIMAFFRDFSCPWISRRSSGIAVNPRSANMTTPIGMKDCVGSIVVRFEMFIFGMNQTKIPTMSVMIAMIPHVSIFLTPRRPFFRRRVKMSQKAREKRRA